MTFREFFYDAVGAAPYHYQEALATEGPTESRLLDVPTGLGKTAAVVLGWLWRRRFAADEVRKEAPRRLVYCLPMRVLVEQTRDSVLRWTANLRAKGRLSDNLPVHLLMGGEEQTDCSVSPEEEQADWVHWPERDAVLIGTQDMLLSRALNRGYAARRARWPIEFGLLNNDCLWVLDEVQLMGVGLTTTAQLDAFAKKLWAPMKPARFFWMSATLGESFLETRDRKDWAISTPTLQTLGDDDQRAPAVQQRLRALKRLQIIKERPKPGKILEAHSPGRISLVMVNTVSTARIVYAGILDELEKAAGKRKPKALHPDVCLLHSRFRPMDRERQMQQVLAFQEQIDSTGAVADSEGLIVVSTQVVEAGFDISSARLWGEIAPWPSVIQRLGRLRTAD